MGTLERRKKEKELRKEQIIKAAEKFFLKKGLQEATIEDIAEYCELSKATLYLYFKNKDELFYTIVLKGLEALYFLLKENITKYNLAEDKLKSIGQAYLKFNKEFPDYFKIIINYCEDLYKKKNVKLSEIEAKIIKMNNEIWELCVSIINEGINNGEFRNDINPFEFSIFMWSTSNGIIQQLNYFKNFEHSNIEYFNYPINEIDYEKMLLKLWELLLNYLKKR